MPSLKILVFLGIVFGPAIIQGQLCPRTNKEAEKNCVSECVPFIGCSSSKKECICDGDCGYSCVEKVFRCKAPEPNPLDNGERVVQSRKFNGTVTFTCNPGYILSGSSVRRCRGRKTWDGVEPRCGKSCPDPGLVGNNTLRREPIRNGSGFVTSETLHYYCNPEYIIDGEDSITCQADGTWSGSTPQCYRISCQAPTLPDNSEVFRPTWFNASQGARDGRKLYLTCNPGYNKIGTSSVMTCSAGQWQLSTSFKCSPKNCGDPGAPVNGGKNGLLYHFKSKVTFYCNECYKLVGAGYRVCNADQSWSDKNPTCQKVQTQCEDISDIANGQGTLTSTECGGEATFSCDRYYNLVGSPKIVCNASGKWSEKTPRCEPPCYVSATENLISKKIYRHGEKAELKCKKGFELSGADDGAMPVCVNGAWSPAYLRFPYCAKKSEIDKSIKDFYSSFHRDTANPK